MQNQCEIDLGNQCWSTITASTSEDLRAHKVTHEDVHTLLSCIMSVSSARSAWTHMMSISQGHLLSDHTKKTMRERFSLSHAYTHVHGTHARTHTYPDIQSHNPNHFWINLNWTLSCSPHLPLYHLFIPRLKHDNYVHTRKHTRKLCARNTDLCTPANTHTDVTLTHKKTSGMSCGSSSKHVVLRVKTGIKSLDVLLLIYYITLLNNILYIMQEHRGVTSTVCSLLGVGITEYFTIRDTWPNQYIATIP